MNRKSEFWMYHSARRTACSGGQTAAHPSLANPTGSVVGTGVEVSGA